MAKQDIETTEYTWDDGTYQTGAAQPGKSQSGLIAGLLSATIFLGGIASALGLMNIRLLRQLSQPTDPVLPVSVDATGGPVGEFLRENPELVPIVPEHGRVQLHLSEGSDGQHSAAAVTAQLTVLDSQGQSKTGPALILSADGYLLTNAHLTDSALSITAQLPDGRTVRAALVACDPYSDLAVVYVQVDDLTAAVFADEGQAMESDTPGPAFDAAGRVLGFRCYDLEGGQTEMISARALMDIATQLVQTRCVSGRPCVGLQVRAMTNFCRQYWGLEYGVEITDSQTEGLLPGDILLSLDGQQLHTCHQLHRLLQDIQPGGNVKLEIFRAGQRFTITIPVTVNP